MLKYPIQRQSIRFYHEASSRQRAKLPTVRLANSKLQYANATRRTQEAPVRVEGVAPHQMFEPYPYKVTEENVIEVLRRKVNPLYDLPYEEQLSSKESHCRNSLRALGQELYASGTSVRLNVNKLPCHVNKIIASPQLQHYRNREDLSIWRGLDGKTITAGFHLFPIGRHGDTICVAPEGLDTIKPDSAKLCKLINEFLRDHAKLPVCMTLGVDGGWRRFLIRSNQDDELQLAGILNPRTLRVGEVLEDRDNFKEFMVRRCQEEGLKLRSLYYQPCPHLSCAHKDVPYELLAGQRTLLETIGKFSFHMTPETYMFESSIGAELVVGATRDTIKECFLPSEEGANSRSNKPMILCSKSGPGIIAMNLADMAEHVMGVDSCPQSVDDATANAEMNGVKNVQFVNAELEIIMERILQKFGRDGREMIVVATSSSSGIHPNVVRVLRNNRNIGKLILVINKIDSTRVMDNILNLCSRVKGLRLPPFAPILATPVDTCPHTENYQTILALERVPE